MSLPQVLSEFKFPVVVGSAEGTLIVSCVTDETIWDVRITPEDIEAALREFLDDYGAVKELDGPLHNSIPYCLGQWLFLFSEALRELFVLYDDPSTEDCWAVVNLELTLRTKNGIETQWSYSPLDSIDPDEDLEEEPCDSGSPV